MNTSPVCVCKEPCSYIQVMNVFVCAKCNRLICGDKINYTNMPKKTKGLLDITKNLCLIHEKNYNHASHSHCWNQVQPSACGIPLEKHTQCCLCDLKVPEKKEERAFIKVDPQEFKDAKFDVKVDVERACCEKCQDVIPEGEFAGEPMCNHISCPCHTLASSEENKGDKDAIKTLQNGMDTPYTSKEPRVEEWEAEAELLCRDLLERYNLMQAAQRNLPANNLNYDSAFLEVKSFIRSLLSSERPQTIGEENDKNRLWFDRGMVQERSRLKGVVREACKKWTAANHECQCGQKIYCVRDFESAFLDDIIKAI